MAGVCLVSVYEHMLKCRGGRLDLGGPDLIPRKLPDHTILLKITNFYLHNICIN